MSEFFRAPSATPISLEEAVIRFEEVITPGKPQAALDGVEILSALAANQSFLVDFIVKELNRPDKGYQSSNNYTDITIHIYTGPSFHLRANVWSPSKNIGGTTQIIDRLHAYNLGHNHNFHFLTIGYYGPGYETTMAEFDPSVVGGNPIGQRAYLKNVRRLTLNQGNMIYFEANTDAHIQHPASSLSVSLNLMPKQVDVNVTEQYEFDFSNDRIIDYIKGQVSHRVALVKMLGLLGRQGYRAELERLATCSPCARTRLECFKQLIAVEGRDDVRRLASNDGSGLVRDWLMADAPEQTAGA
jgi:hypothetical protein